MTYDQVFRDWDTLWAIGPAYDITGAYVDQEDLDKLLRSPNKRTATDCLQRQINYWFQVGPDDDGTHISAEQAIAENPHIQGIAIRYGYAYLLEEEE